MLIVGDETAVPAISAILEQVDRDVVGTAYLEVPSGADELSVDAPAGVRVHWLPRDGAAHGSRMVEAVRAHLTPKVPVGAATAPGTDEIDPNLWETPAYSSSGEEE